MLLRCLILMASVIATAHIVGCVAFRGPTHPVNGLVAEAPDVDLPGEMTVAFEAVRFDSTTSRLSVTGRAVDGYTLDPL